MNFVERIQRIVLKLSQQIDFDLAIFVMAHLWSPVSFAQWKVAVSDKLTKDFDELTAKAKERETSSSPAEAKRERTRSVRACSSSLWVSVVHQF